MRKTWHGLLVFVILAGCKPPKSPENKRVFADGYIDPLGTSPCTCPTPSLDTQSKGSLSPLACPQLEATWNQTKRDFEELLQRSHLINEQNYQVPGGAVAVVWRGQLLYSQGFGTRSYGQEAPGFAASTLVTSGSLSKMITAVTVLRLVEKGLLDLDRPVASYLKADSAFLRRAEDQAAADRITLRQLLSHSAGIPDELPSGVEEYGPAVCEEGPDAYKTYFRLHAKDPLWSPPGAIWNYSNPSYFLAAAVVEAVTGESFESVSKRLVLDAAGMKSATWSGAEAERTQNFATGYEVWSPDGRSPRLQSFTPQSTSCRVFQPAAGLEASVEDYARFAMGLMTKQTSSLLSPSSKELLQTPQIETFDQGWAYSLGFFVDQQYKGRKLLAHDGAAWGYRSLFLMVPAEGFALIVVQNAGLTFPENLWDFGLKTTDRWLGLPPGPRLPSSAEEPSLEGDMSGIYQAWTYDMEHYQESQPAYLSLEVRLQKAPDAGSFLWDDTAFGEAELKIVSWPLVELSYPDSRLDLKLRAVRALDGGHYLVSRDFVAKRIKR